MGRRRKLTRRQRALCWCLALTLVAGLGGLQYRYLSYWGPVREAEDRGGIGKTERLMDVKLDSDRYRYSCRRMLRGNQRALMAVSIDSYGFFYGWDSSRVAYLDCTKPKALHAAVYRLGSFYQDISKGEGCCQADIEFFGRVDDPAVDKVRLELFRRPDLPAGAQAENVGTVEIPRLEWVKKDDLVVFERQFTIAYRNNNGEMTARFALLDWEGKVLETWEQLVGWYGNGEENYF